MATELVAERMRVRGTVQGVGFRPTVWRIAREIGLAGSVINDAEGVLIVAVGSALQLDALVRRVQTEPPPLARITAFEREPLPLPGWLDPAGFVIGPSRMGAPMTAVAPDAAICAACAAEIVDPFARRFRYPLANCTHCGPRLAFTTGVPYDRARTTMVGFTMCAACRTEYEAPTDRRFHAEAIACHACGPRVTLQRLDGRAFALDRYTFLDECDAAGTLLAKGQIVAIKGLGGYQLACDATHAEAVQRLRAIKRREAKPFALMAASVDAVRAWCTVSEAEAALLASPAAPIVLLARRGTPPPLPLPAIADGVAPGLATLGFMLPSTGVHTLILRRMARPIVLTSGNLSDEHRHRLRARPRASDRAPRRRLGRARDGRRAARAAPRARPCARADRAAARLRARAGRAGLWRRAEEHLLPAARGPGRAVPASRRPRRRGGPGRLPAFAAGPARLLRLQAGAAGLRRAPRIPVDQARARRGRAGRGAAPPCPYRRLPGRERLAAARGTGARRGARRARLW
jgi:acylphosphatase/tRNA A37 threonylcarbamoyladenosine synthetase subunit TsaC/SUA5/YrdC/DNA-directed RNA polymerase subunit RPC12/RpoP